MRDINYKKLADFWAVVHGLWMLWFVVNMPLVIIYDWYKWIVLIMIATMFFSWIVWGNCPFIIWENKLRQKGDSENVYSGPFISHYIKKFIGISVSKNIVRVVRTVYIIILLWFAIF